MRKLYAAGLALAAFAFTNSAFAQESNPGQIGGNVEITAQYYNEDTLIGAQDVPEQALMNAYANLIYNKGDFEAGVRYESYTNPLLGFDPGWEGQGVFYRYAKYTVDELEITAGTYYEQFGSGMILRTYEAPTLGWDNALDGFRVKYNPAPGIYLKGIWGRQRFFFDRGTGIVRGFDGEIVINELKEEWMDNETNIIIGGSFVSKYQEDRDPLYVLPENVGAYGGRISVSNGGFNVAGEYVYKINDPSKDNQFIYKPGQGLLVNAQYSTKGFGIMVGGKLIDNMSFRSDRTQSVNNLMVNYHPALTKQHTYALAATLYPYATQPNGEVAGQIELSYKIPKKTKLGGKYGTKITVNLSYANAPDTTQINFAGADSLDPRTGWSTNFFGVGSNRYYHDYNIEIRRKVSKNFSFAVTYLDILYNMDVIQGLAGKGIVKSDIAIWESTLKLKNKKAIRWELQHMWVAAADTADPTYYEDQGNWAFGLIELTKSPHWFVSVLDQYNYGNKDEDKRLHYITGSVGYIKGASRFTVSYGRQRAGIFCVGGVCRNVPASNGLTLSISSTF